MSEFKICYTHKPTDHYFYHPDDCDVCKMQTEITRLRAKLAEVEGQEPVATLTVNETTMSASYHLEPLSVLPIGEHSLYTNPAPAKVPEGYALVPIEPTEAMMDAAAEVFFNLESSQWDDVLLGAYEAMLEAQGGSEV